jgi:hypothetical protein
LKKSGKVERTLSEEWLFEKYLQRTRQSGKGPSKITEDVKTDMTGYAKRSNSQTVEVPTRAW